MITQLAYTKEFASRKQADLEVHGHTFFGKYYSNIPHLLLSDNTASIGFVRYEDRCLDGVVPLTDKLAQGEYVNVRSALTVLATIAKRDACHRPSEGGTELFYLDRLARLNPAEPLYAQWAAQNSPVSLNDKTLLVDVEAIRQIREQVQRFARGLCAPSQGDLHERNMLTDGTIVDFEGAGWNLIATDIATFLWHTLFAGNHFGPLYAKWSQKKDKELFFSNAAEIRINSSNDVYVALGTARQDLLNDYVECFYEKFPLTLAIEKDIAAAIAFRLLTTFPVANMSPEDQYISFVLVNLFMGQPSMSLTQKLELLCGQKLRNAKQ